MIIVSVSPYPKLVVIGGKFKYEARLWNLIVIAGIIGFVMGVIL